MTTFRKVAVQAVRFAKSGDIILCGCETIGKWSVRHPKAEMAAKGIRGTRYLSFVANTYHATIGEKIFFSYTRKELRENIAEYINKHGIPA